MSTIHKSKWGTYHPDPNNDVAWTVNDTQGYMDGGPACDECGACECWSCKDNGCCASEKVACLSDNHKPDCELGHTLESRPEEYECIGLSVAYVCLDGGESLCEECFAKEQVEVVDCDCP